MREVGITRNFPTGIRASVYHAQIAQGRYRRLPGRPVGIIEVQPLSTRNDYNHLILTFTVSPYRKNMRRVLLQNKRKDCLSGYAKSLFDSCFKYW